MIQALRRSDDDGCKWEYELDAVAVVEEAMAAPLRA